MSPRGREHGLAGGTGPVNNKIYYPSGRHREGADGGLLFPGISRQVWRVITGGSLRGWRRCSGLSVAPVRGLRLERDSTWKYESSEVAANFTQSLVHALNEAQSS